MSHSAKEAIRERFLKFVMQTHNLTVELQIHLAQPSISVRNLQPYKCPRKRFLIQERLSRSVGGEFNRT